MNRNFRLLAFLSGMGIFFLILAGCAGGPKPAPAAEAEEAPAEDDVWALLAKGDIAGAKKLFQGKVDINSTDRQGRTPLHVAAELEDPDLAAFFIALRAEVDALDRQNRTPLGISTEKRDGPTAAVLAAAGADIHHPIPGGDSPAIRAVALGGGFLSAILTPASVQSADSEGRTILHLAAAAGKVEILDTILNAGNVLNKWDKEGKTALDIALGRPDSKAHMQTAERLILAGGYSENPIFSYLAPAVRSSNYNIRLDDGLAPLHFAAGDGYLGLVQYLLDKKVDINIKNAAGTTPLHEAARAGNIPIMGLLIAGGANINAQDAKGNSPMHMGTPPEKHRDALSLLLSHGANPNLRDEHGDSPLHITVTLNRNNEVLRTLLEKGADVSLRNIDGKTPLYLAVEEERINTITLLLRYKSDLFAADNGGMTPLELALRERSPALPSLITTESVLQSDSGGNTPLIMGVKAAADITTIGLILDKNALVNARNKEGDTALHLAVRQNEREIGELLLVRGADVFAPNAKGESPLYLAFHSPGGVREWILNPAVLTARDGLGNSVLHYAAQWKLDSYIPLIVQKGVSTEVANATGETPLFMAVKVNSASTVRVLISAGASITARDTLGNSGLHAAVRWNAPQAAETLIGEGINIDVHALNGKTPLHDAVRLGITEVEALLIHNGADLEVRDTEGNTPFMEAVMAGYPTSVERLADYGADPTARNVRGDTPLHIAIATERSDLVTLLLNWGAQIHARNIMGRTPFQNALVTSTRMVSTLLTKDRIFAADDDGHSPLHIAVLDDAAPGIIKTIIDQGGRVSAIDGEGRTPLRLAVDLGKWEQAKLLADAGSDVFSTAGDGKTPAGIALSKGKTAVNALFSGRAISAKDPQGNTILHYAAQNGSPDMISLLIDLGANKNIKNISAESPGDIAQRWNRNDIARLLNS
ncbi:MAG: ankyrin repeat domain-containing protein [Treponema sp.]|jgi:ankyrin repeat protein|nr:ankyrin repeat domain-containing protein [Treponema sp.]